MQNKTARNITLNRFLYLGKYRAQTDE